MRSTRLRIGLDLGALDACEPSVSYALTTALGAVPADDSTGVEIVLFAPSPPSHINPALERFESHRMPLGGLGPAQRAVSALWFPGALRRAGIDVVHVPGGEAVPGADLPVVLGVDDLASFDVDRALPWQAQARRRRLLPSAIARATAFIVPSRFVANRLHAHFAVSQSRIQVVPPVLPRHIEAAPIGTVRARYGIIGRIILVPAPTAPQGEQVVALRAMKHLAERHRETTLVLIGEVGTNEKRVQRELDDLELRSRVVRITGAAPAVRSSLFEHAEVVVYPGVHDGPGAAVLEAMACGVPLVVARGGAAAELAAEAAAVIDPGDDVQLAVELHAILSDGEWSRRRVRAALERAREWSPAGAAEGLLAAYRSVVVDH